MPKATPDQVVTQKHIRAFTQRGGPRPNNRTRFAGADEQLMQFGDVTTPVRGGTDPIRVHDPYRRGGYKNIGSTVSAPDFDSGSIEFMIKHGGISWIAGDLTCPNNFYEAAGVCKNPADLQMGWSDYVRVYSYGQANERTTTGNTSFEDDEGNMHEVEFTYEGGVYEIGGLGFGEQGAAQVEREVVDLVYGGSTDCGNCGAADDGTQRIYAVTKSSGSGSPGTPAEVVYTTNGGSTWSNVNITGLGAAVDPTGIAVVGNFLVVLDTAGNGYYYAELNTLTGAPGAWTNVTTGFVAASQPNDIYVASPSEVYFAGQGGYVYKSTDITAGVTALNAGAATTTDLIRIHGADETIVAVGESGVIIISTNRGVTFATATTTPTSATIRALAVMDQFRFWIGTSGGKVYYTLNQGAIWTEQTFSGATVIDDIVFATDEVGYVAARTSAPAARLFSTFTAGYAWSSSATAGNPRILNFPTFNYANRLAVPTNVPNVTAANNVALGGLSGGGTDGVIFLGVANEV